MNKLTEQEKSAAIAKWNLIREDYSVLKGLISFNTSFSFSKDACDLIDNEANLFVQMFMGILDEGTNQLVFILPIKESEIELGSLEKYFYVTGEPLASDLVFKEERKTITINKITLNTNLEVIKNMETKDLPFENVPSISSEKAILEIQAWRNSYLDWMFMNSADSKMFNSFFVPTKDLTLQETSQMELKCVFAMRESILLNTAVPTLVFVTVVDEALEPEDTGGQNALNVVLNNTGNFASPCPPFCRMDPTPSSIIMAMN